jgi:beta-aspartyl-peptidase (threonine type)
MARNERGRLAALEAGRALLADGGAAVDAVEATIRVLEDEPVFNAGYGSVLNADGQVEMDAALMDGTSLALGGVGAIQGVRHPISVARLMLADRPTLLVGPGARAYAAEKGAELRPPEAMISPERGVAPDVRDTVGCVALDQTGRIAAGTSTGGLPGKRPGRVGDSPLPGCGLYADDALGGVSVSGEGEAISRVLLAARVMQALESDGPQRAAEQALAWMDRTGAEAGIIALDRRGRLGWAHNSRQFTVALAASWLDAPRAYARRDETDEDFEHG